MLKQTLQHYRKPIILGLVAIILILLPMFLPSLYYAHLLITAGINTILAMTFVLLLRTGMVNMSIAAFMGIGAYASALLVTRLGLSFWLSLPMAAIITGVIALCLGVLLVRTAGFGAVILTAVVGMMVPLIIGSIDSIGGFQGIKNIPPPDAINLPFLPAIDFFAKLPNYYLMLLLLLIVILLYSGLYAAWTGRAWMAIGLNTNLAESLGINIFKYRLLAWVVVCATAGLVGGFYAHYIGAITPVAFGVFKTIYVHVYAILGGLDYVILGPVIGSIVMTFIPEFMRVAKVVEPIITGVLLVLLILFLPGGVLSLKDIWARKRRRLQPVVEIERTVKPLPPVRSRAEGAKVLLQVEDITKYFGGLAALEDVNLHVNDSEILGLIGPNGAGKTTLINVISGFYPPTSGRVAFEGRSITGYKAPRVATLGIARTFQASSLFMNLKTVDNVFTGYHMNYKSNALTRVLRFPAARREEASFRRSAEEILEFMGLGALKNEYARNLPHGHQRILGVCMALTINPKLLLLDEPVTGMNTNEIDTMMGLIEQIRGRGVTIVMIEHNMETVMNLCDRIVVLNYGKKIADGSPREIQENEEVIEAYLGKE